VFLGSSAWWLLLAFGVEKLKKRMNARILGLISRGAGVILLAFGLWSVYAAITLSP